MKNFIKGIFCISFIIGCFLLVGVFTRQLDRSTYPVMTKNIIAEISSADGKVVLPSGAFVKGELYEYFDEDSAYADNPIVEGKKTFNQKIVKGDATIYWSQDQYLAATSSDNK